jgi:hypothetical protein
MAIRIISLADFRSSKNVPENFALRKQYDTEVKAVDGDERKLQFTISTGDVDRDADRVRPEGWILSNFRKAGVVLWAHNYAMPPIAKPTDTWLEDGKLKSIAKFLPEDFADTEHVRFANMIFRMYQERFLRATSVGFRPLKWAFSEERGNGAVDFERQELLEYSAVPVPANPNALEGAKSLGIDLEPLVMYVERSRDNGTIDGQFVDAVRKAAGKSLPIINIPEPQPEPTEVKGAISYDSAHSNGTPKAADDSEWDGAREVAAASVDDLKAMSAWVDSERQDTKDGYKLPHHNAAGQHAVVWSGVRAAMAALLGARGGVDIPEGDRGGVHAHLARHYGEFDKEVPELRTYDETELDAMFSDRDGEPEQEAAPQPEPKSAQVAVTIEGLAALDAVASKLIALNDGLQKTIERLEKQNPLMQNRNSEETDDLVDVTADQILQLVRRETRHQINKAFGLLED